MRRPLLLGLSLLGLWDSSYLWWIYTSPSHPMVCLGEGCDVVRASPYAHLWGHPLPLYGALMYAALALLILAEPFIAGARGLWARNGIAVVSGAGVAASLYLTRIEAVVLHAWCEWCVVSAVAVTLIFILALSDLIRSAPSETAPARAVLRGYVTVCAIVLALGIPGFLLLARHGELPPLPPASAAALEERLVRPDSHMMGDREAPIAVVEFADFECPICGSAQPVVQQALKRYGGRIRFVFRQFPIPAIHPYAETAAEASECAAEQGKFWEAVDKLYDGQTDLSQPALERYAGELGLDVQRFHGCLSSGEQAARVRRDVADGHALGVRSTPTFFIGNQRIEGALEFDQFARTLDQELTKGASKSSQTASTTASPRGSGAGQKPNADPGGANIAFGRSASNAFAQSQNSELACSEDELKKYQPTLIRTPEVQAYFQSPSKRPGQESGFGMGRFGLGPFGGVLVDVRPSREFGGGRIPGAINVPVEEIGRRWAELPRDRPIVLYESGRSPGDVCGSSRAAARLLRAHGFRPELLKVYQDGLAGWQKAGLPVTP